MLESTFIHCPGIGIETERRLWSSGARSWSEYLELEGRVCPSRVHQILRPLVEESVDRLLAGDYAWFAHILPQREHWRAYPAFRHRIAYLDIETTGGIDSQSLTVVGLYDGLRLRQFVKGDNLDEFPEAIDKYAMLVTFFGTGFDLPFLRRAFGMDFHQLHVDLCFLLKRLGHKGGLKRVEQAFGLIRSAETVGLSGADAVELWWLYKRGDETALQKLLAYNADDVINLETLLETAYPLIAAKTMTE